MTIRMATTCDGCGKQLGASMGSHSGSFFGAAVVALGETGVGQWHACSAACAAAFLRKSADLFLEREKADRADEERASRSAAADRGARERNDLAGFRRNSSSAPVKV